MFTMIDLVNCHYVFPKLRFPPVNLSAFCENIRKPWWWRWSEEKRCCLIKSRWNVVNTSCTVHWLHYLYTVNYIPLYTVHYIICILYTTLLSKHLMCSARTIYQASKIGNCAAAGKRCFRIGLRRQVKMIILSHARKKVFSTHTKFKLFLNLLQ